jgi:hypothetical protein
MDKKLNNLREDVKEQQSQFLPESSKRGKHHVTKHHVYRKGGNLLSKGLKHNLHHKQKQFIRTLALEAQMTISKLSPVEQGPIRYQVALNIEKLYRQRGNKNFYNNRRDISEK